MQRIQIDHIAVAVDDMEQSLAFWRDALGLPLAGTENNASEAVQVAFLPAGEGRIELIQPTTDDSGVARYMAKHGSGLHHLCLAVPELDSSVDRLRTHGVELINDVPRVREDGTRYVFIHPKSTGGVLVELYEAGDDGDEG